MHGLEVRELGAEQGRPRDRGRRALRRPVTGKVSAFAPGREGDPLRHRRGEVGKIRETDIPVVGPLKLALSELTGQVREAAAERPPDRAPWLRQLEDWRERFPFRYEKSAGTLKPQTVVEALRDLACRPRRGRDLDDRCRPAPDVGDAVHPGRHPRTFITSGGLGTMGYGLPAAIGAKAARPTRTSSASTVTGASR
jgi:acetolactate synthase-1/2/3 large subunit